MIAVRFTLIVLAGAAGFAVPFVIIALIWGG